jgi:4-hydroxyphenylpyruvate dioxygenase-like putative hemolysin
MDPAGGVARFLDRRGEGYHHLCFETPDISAALARAREASLPLIDSTPRPGLAGLIAFLHPRATHGVLVEMAQPPTPSPHPDTSSSTGVGALGIGTVCVAVEDLSAAAKTYARNFDGRADTPIREGGLGGHACAVQVGRSRVTLVHSTDPGSPVRRFLAQRGEGIFGLCLHVADLEAALRHLAVVGIPTEAQVRGTTTVLARVDPARVYGVNLYLCPSTSRTLPHTVVD